MKPHASGRGWIAVVFGLALSACGGGDQTDALAGAPPFCADVIPAVREFAEAHGNVGRGEAATQVVVGGIAEIPQGMQVALASDYVAVQHQQFVNLMTLVQYDEDLNPIPYLATSWDVAEDGSSITFTLRDDVFWHDGEVTDAHDVAFTFRTLRHPDTGFPNGSYWSPYLPGDAAVEVIDDTTVRFHTLPHAEPLDTWRTVAILPEHLLGDVPPSELAQHPFGSQCPVGNGPFIFAEHVEGDRWVFEANPAFPEDLGGRPTIDRYVYRVIPDASTLLLELMSGAVDLYVNVAAGQADDIRANSGTELRAFPFRSVVFAAWNGRTPELADSRVRTALTLAVDRAAIVSTVLEGFGTVANTTVPLFHWAFEDSNDHQYDPALAGQLLDAAGFVDRDGDGVRESADGEPLRIGLLVNQGSSSFSAVALTMQAQLREVGVDLQVETLEWGTIVAQIIDPDSRDFEGVLLQWVAEFKPDDTELFHSDSHDAPYGFAGTANPEVDRLLESLKATVNRDEAGSIWREYQEVLRDEHPYTFLYYPDRLAGVSDRLGNVRLDARGEWQNISEWVVTRE